MGAANPFGCAFRAIYSQTFQRNQSPEQGTHAVNGQSKFLSKSCASDFAFSVSYRMILRCI
jgi:hypothetical protein